MSSHARVCVAIAAACLAACASQSAQRTAQSPQPPPGYDFPSDVRLPNSDRVFLVLTFSGGGTRAAALSFGVLEQMTRDSICVDDNAKSVADEIDIISAVSGGSFTAAYFALHG